MLVVALEHQQDQIDSRPRSSRALDPPLCANERGEDQWYPNDAR